MSEPQQDDRQKIEATFALQNLKRRTRLLEIASKPSSLWTSILGECVLLIILIFIYLRISQNVLLLVTSVTVSVMIFVASFISTTNARIDAIVKILHDITTEDEGQKTKRSSTTPDKD